MGVFNLFVEGLYYICGVACAAAAVQQIGNELGWILKTACNLSLIHHQNPVRQIDDFVNVCAHQQDSGSLITKLNELNMNKFRTSDINSMVVKIVISTLIALVITFVVLALVSDHPLENFIIILTSPVKNPA